MASGDTKTEALLNILGNGGDASEYRGCCNTKTQQYILDAIDRIEHIQPGGSYDAGTGIEIADNTISVDTDTIQEKLTAGTGITISDNTISATGGGGGADKPAYELSESDYNWNSSTDSATEPYNSIALWLLPSGIYRVPNDTLLVYLYSNNRSWKGLFIVGEKGSYGVSILSVETSTFVSGRRFSKLYAVGATGVSLGSLNISEPVQTTGTSTTDVMSQDATTKMIYNTSQPSSIPTHRICIGRNAITYPSDGVGIGTDVNIASNDYTDAIAIGHTAIVSAKYGIAIGSRAKATRQGELNIGSPNYNYGYNNTSYRIIGGVHDPVDNHDAATKGYVDGLVGNVADALNAINNGTQS